MVPGPSPFLPRVRVDALKQSVYMSEVQAVVGLVGVTLTERQAEVLRILADAGDLGRDYWQLEAAMGRSPMQSIRVLRRKGLVEYHGGSYFIARPRPALTVLDGGASEAENSHE